MFSEITYLYKVIRTYFISDKKYLVKRFIKKLGYIPNIDNPKTFNEKVTARMIFERDAFHTKMADKLAVREIILGKISASHIVPLVGVYNSCTEINLDKLPLKFVLKCNHDSGSAIICNDKNQFNFKAAKLKLSCHLKQNMYFMKREWHYKNICPTILAEKYIDLLTDKVTNLTITTCRVHCFEAHPRFIEVDIQDKQKNEYSNIYDILWTLQPFTVDLKKNAPSALEKPDQLNILIELSQTLCLKFCYSRIDFLISPNNIYFSEITLTPNAGRMVITPNEWDLKLGEYWTSI